MVENPMSPYRVITSDGKKHHILADSAAAAIEEIRWLFRGQTVTEVYSGLKQEDCDLMRRMDKDARPLVGFIMHEVPPHGPIPEETIRAKTKRSHVDSTSPMFDEEAIQRESESAKRKKDL